MDRKSGTMYRPSSKISESIQAKRAERERQEREREARRERERKEKPERPVSCQRERDNLEMV